MFCQISMIKPLFFFLNAEDKLLLEIGGENFIKHWKQNLHYPEVYKEVDAEVISVRIVTFLLDYFFLSLGKVKTQIGFGLISKIRSLKQFFKKSITL